MCEELGRGPVLPFSLLRADLLTPSTKLSVFALVSQHKTDSGGTERRRQRVEYKGPHEMFLSHNTQDHAAQQRESQWLQH